MSSNPSDHYCEWSTFAIHTFESRWSWIQDVKFIYDLLFSQVLKHEDVLDADLSIELFGLGSASCSFVREGEGVWVCVGKDDPNAVADDVSEIVSVDWSLVIQS